MPIGPRCGDSAKIEYEVSSELIGSFAHVRVVRKNTRGLAADSFLEIKQAKTTIVWPDLKVNGNHCGGSQFDPRDLEKESYKDRFSAQEFKLEILCEDDSKESEDAIPVTGYDPEPDEEKKTGFPVMSTWVAEKIQVLDPKAGIVRVKKLRYSPKIEKHINMAVSCNVGHYWIGFKDGEIILKVNLDLSPDDKRVNKEKLLRYVKRSVEAYWNDPGRGLGQWVYHRKACLRKKDCNCSVKSNRNEYGVFKIAHGCCKFSVRLIIENGPDNKVKVVSLTKEEQKQRLASIRASKPNEWATPNLRANTMKFYFPENRFGTYAHEVGHMLGLPDQYAGGAESSEAEKFPIDNNSVMGSRKGGGRVPKDYIESGTLILDWVRSHVDDVEPLG
jgi:hypothetical protein